MLQFMGSQRVGHDWTTELNWVGARIMNHFWSYHRRVGKHGALGKGSQLVRAEFHKACLARVRRKAKINWHWSLSLLGGITRLSLPHSCLNLLSAALAVFTLIEVKMAWLISRPWQWRLGMHGDISLAGTNHPSVPTLDVLLTTFKSRRIWWTLNQRHKAWILSFSPDEWYIHLIGRI